MPRPVRPCRNSASSPPTSMPRCSVRTERGSRPRPRSARACGTRARASSCTSSKDIRARSMRSLSVPTFGPDQIWNWTRMVTLRPLTWEERREASLVDNDPDAPLTVGADETKWLDPAAAENRPALVAAANDASNLSWSANLRLGEIDEQQNAPDLLAGLRCYAKVAGRPDAEIAVCERKERKLHASAVQGRAR